MASWEYFSDRYGEADTNELESEVGRDTPTADEAEALSTFLDATVNTEVGVEERIGAVDAAFNNRPTTRSVAAAIGTDEETVKRVRERFAHARRRERTAPKSPIYEEVASLDDGKAVADCIRYYFDGVVNEFWLETAAVGQLDDSVERHGIGNVVRQMREKHVDFDTMQAEKVVGLARGLGVVDKVVKMEVGAVREKCLTTLEACLTRYAELALDCNSEERAARLELQFPRIAERRWGPSVIGYAAGTGPKAVREAGVQTNPGGIEIDPVRRRAIERDEGVCVRCDSNVAAVHRVLPVTELRPTTDMLACLCEECYWEAHEETTHNRRYEMPDEFWAWARAPNTNLGG